MSQGESDKETGRQGDEEILRQRDSFSLSPPLLVFLSVAFGGVAAVALGWVAAKLYVAGFAPTGLLPLAIGNSGCWENSRRNARFANEWLTVESNSVKEWHSLQVAPRSGKMENNLPPAR